MESYRLTLSQSGRLDASLAKALPEFSRSSLQRLIRDGEVRVNGEVVRKPAALVEEGDVAQLSAPASPAPTLEPQPLPLEILFEDERVLVVNKRAGMVVHPAPGHEQGTLANAVLAHAPEIDSSGAEGRPGIVHRLDKDTSGVIVVAKHSGALESLQRQFEDRKVVKLYLGLVDGRPPTATGVVEAAIARDPRHRKRFAISRSRQAREAITKYQTRESFASHSLLEIEPQTGRTHQIRIHMRSLKCPIVGDTVYGRRRPTIPVTRQMLHARSIELILPGSSSTNQFQAPLPADFVEALSIVRATTP
jgi:23S rRNA pseudouridine1911/1915/1917 synthase